MWVESKINGGGCGVTDVLITRRKIKILLWERGLVHFDRQEAG